MNNLKDITKKAKRGELCEPSIQYLKKILKRLEKEKPVKE
jgi:hypothetical protein